MLGVITRSPQKPGPWSPCYPHAPSKNPPTSCSRCGEILGYEKEQEKDEYKEYGKEAKQIQFVFDHIGSNYILHKLTTAENKPDLFRQAVSDGNSKSKAMLVKFSNSSLHMSMVEIMRQFMYE